ncbi:MAG: DUF58 domain-containing protein [Planctomycetota bacterium]
MTRRYHLHLPGFAYFALVMLVGVAAMNSQNNLLFWIFGLMASGLVVSGLVSGIMMTRLRCRRLDPQHGQVGEPLATRYAITNRSRLLPAFDIHVEELADAGRSTWSRLTGLARAWVMHVGPRETVHGEAVSWPTARGEAQFDRVRIWTTFPFGIIKKSVTFSQPQHTLIYPRLYELRRHVLRTVSTDGVLGIRTTQRAGAGDDYFGMREYRPGDQLRNISWKRSAALDTLICVERSRPSPPRLRVVLDLTQRSEPLALEEDAISLAASVLHAADLEGFEIGLSVCGVPFEHVQLRRGHWHLQKILAALAALDLAGAGDAGGATVPDIEGAGLIVIHPDRVDPAVGGGDALHLSARQLGVLAVRPIGWDPTRARQAAGRGAAA